MGESGMGFVFPMPYSFPIPYYCALSCCIVLGIWGAGGILVVLLICVGVEIRRVEGSLGRFDGCG